nr:filamentous hemagglutinin N-terminal domain-containing protein [uncultured Moellerella sp.]
MKKSVLSLFISLYPVFLFATEIPDYQKSPELIQQIKNKGSNNFKDLASKTEIILSENNVRANIISLDDFADVNNQKHYFDGDLIPVINLNESDNDGVSHNYFSKLDIGKNKAAFFNNRNMENPANLVIAEVNDIKKTMLAGHLGMLGKEASLIVANPMGIDCVSCSFNRINNVTLLAGKIERKAGDRIEFKKQFDKAVTMSGTVDLTKISNVDIYADKIYIYRNTIIKADKINFNISDGVEQYTSNKYRRDRMKAPVILPLSKNAGIYINPWSEINANNLNIKIVNAKFINSGDLYGYNNLKIEISDTNNSDIEQNNKVNRVRQNNGVISSGADLFITPNKIKNGGYGLTTGINKEGRVYHYDLTGKIDRNK